MRYHPDHHFESCSSYKKLGDIFLDFFSLTQAGEITYTNTNTPRVGEGIVEFGSRLVTITSLASSKLGTNFQERHGVRSGQARWRGVGRQEDQAGRGGGKQVEVKIQVKIQIKVEKNQIKDEVQVQVVQT